MLALLSATPALGQRQRGRSADSGDVWKVLAEKYDTNKDGRITEAEYSRSRSKFMSFDANADDVLTAADFSGTSRRSSGASILRGADKDGDGAVSAKEWQLFLLSLRANKEGIIPEEQAIKLSSSDQGDRRRRGGSDSGIAAIDRDGDGKPEIADLQRIFLEVDENADGSLSAGELSTRGARPTQLPQVGDVAPDFDLLYAEDEDRSAKLSSFAGKKPVALVFGSYT